MQVFEWRSDSSRYRMLGLADAAWPPLTQRLNGRRIGQQWKPVRLRELDSGVPLPASDIAAWEPSLPPVMTPAAWDAVADLLAPNAEPLAAHGDPGPHYLVNVTRLIPALLGPESEYVRMPDGGILDVTRYALDRRALGPLVFKLAEWPAGPVYVLDSFVRRVESSGLTGGKFRQVWPPVEERSPASVPVDVAKEGDDVELANHIWARICALLDRGTAVADLDEDLRAFYVTRAFEDELDSAGDATAFLDWHPGVGRFVAAGYRRLGLTAAGEAFEAWWQDPLIRRLPEGEAGGGSRALDEDWPSDEEFNRAGRLARAVGRHEEERMAYVRLHPDAYSI